MKRQENLVLKEDMHQYALLISHKYKYIDTNPSCPPFVRVCNMHMGNILTYGHG